MTDPVDRHGTGPRVMMSLGALVTLLLPLVGMGCAVPAGRDGVTPAAPELVWIEGRVVLPEGLPAGEEVVVVSYGHLEPGAHRPRAVVGPDGRFRIGVPKRGIRVRLDVEADHLHMGRTVRASLRRPTDPVVLRPVLAAMVVVELGAEDADHLELLRTAKVGLLGAGEPAFFRYLMGGLAVETPDAGLRVTFRGISTLPDEYAIMLLPRDGFTADLALVELVPGETITVQADVTRGSRVSGRVVDEEGAPIPGVEVGVHVSGQSEEGGWGRNHLTTTTDDGRFDVAPIAPGALCVTARAERYGTVILDLGESRSGAHFQAGSIILPRGNLVTVEVVRPDGTPVTDAAITLDDREAGRRREVGHAYTFGGLDEGPFTTWAVTWRSEREPSSGWAGSGWTWVASHGRLTGVAPGTTARIVVPYPVRIEGRVVDRAGAPLTSYKLEAQPHGSSDFPFGNGYRPAEVEGPSGAFLLELPPGRWTLDVSEGGFASHVIDLPSESPLVLAATRSVNYAGIVRDCDGMPVGGALVVAEHREIRRNGCSIEWSRCLSDADGNWRMSLPAGSVSIEARTETQKTSRAKRSRGEPGGVVRLDLEIE